MEQSPTSSPTHCLNCGTPVTGEFCHQCGQRTRDNSDRSVRRLLGEVLGNIFFLDNRFFISVGYLFRFPGRMTIEFLGGKRKKFISPITLFLFLNLIYFFNKPLSDYSLPLEDQIDGQPHSIWAKKALIKKLRKESLDYETYAPIYQNATDNVSKSIMIINIPIIAAFLYLMAFKRRPFYFDSLIFSFHYFTLYLFSWVMLGWADDLLFFLGLSDTIVDSIRFNLFVSIVPLIYGILSIKKFMDIRWYWAIPAGVVTVVSVLLANAVYRMIIFYLTLWTT
ncbi:MAG: DUF3667 domain-containing protein [Cytophagales bacterium]|nr:DUF3667 domain-containing protein [Cytophagales bacterium]